MLGFVSNGDCLKQMAYHVIGARNIGAMVYPLYFKARGRRDKPADDAADTLGEIA
jgi:hypothetical protein